MSQECYRVLLVEDDPGHAELARRSLASSRDYGFEVEWVTSLDDASKSLTSSQFDVILLDLSLPDGNAVDAVARVRQVKPELPVVVLTSLSSDVMAKALLEQGVQDYLMKHCLVAAGWGAQALVRAIQYAIHRQQASREIQRLLQQAQQQQELLNQKNRHLAKLYSIAQRVVENVSHEFRTPLTVIKEYVSLIHDGVVGTVNEEQRRFLNIVEDRADDLNRMVDDMLDVGKLDAGLLTVRRTECRVEEIIDHVAVGLRQKAAIKGVDLEIVVDTDLPSVFCDADKAGRTLLNLAVNAIKFTQQSGRVRLSAHHDYETREVVVEVTDDGPGIHPRDLRRIFQRFTQVDLEMNGQGKGFGLGLSIAREMVDLNLGVIKATSEPNRGSCFSFTLPVADPEVISQRFIARLMRLKDRPGTLSMCLFETTETTEENMADLEPFLYYVLRSSDLVMRISSRLWLGFVAGDAEGFEKLRRRTAKLLRETNRNRIRAPLPELTAKLVGQWSLSRDFESVVADVLKALPQREVVDVQAVLRG